LRKLILRDSPYLTIFFREHFFHFFHRSSHFFAISREPYLAPGLMKKKNYLNPFPAYVLYSGYEYGIVVITKHNEEALTNALLKLFT